MPAHRKVERNAEIVRLYKQGVLVKVLARRFKIDKGLVGRILKRDCRVRFLIEIPLDEGIIDRRSRYGYALQSL